MNDLRDLYQEVILEHNKHPRHYGKLEEANRAAKGHNPLCGDRFTVYLHMDDGVVKGIAFEGEGCAISKASASLMAEAVQGKTEEEVKKLFLAFHGLVAEEGEAEEQVLGKLAVFAGVRDYPSRVKCATLSWHTLEAALKGDAKASTE